VKSQALTMTTSPVSFDATAAAGSELLRSPVSGQQCVYWRLRIVEHLTARSQLVHELASVEPFELAWSRPPRAAEPPRPPVRVRLDPASTRIQATPVLHREGTPGALAAARAFGFAGLVSVEEIVIRHGEAVSASGILDDPAEVEGPFRGAGRGLELLDATVSLESRSLAPALLPWALGTAAALLGGMGLATYGAWRYHLAHRPAGAHASTPRVFAPPPRLERPEVPHPRMP
jgi:hypothetical protein